MFGWVNLFLTAVAGAMLVTLGVAPGDDAVEWDAMVFFWALVISAIYYLVGASIRNYRTWAKITGALLAVYSLLFVPIGTFIGVGALVYLVRGWKESTPALAAKPA
jgi:hypothetical protein